MVIKELLLQPLFHASTLQGCYNISIARLLQALHKGRNNLCSEKQQKTLIAFRPLGFCYAGYAVSKLHLPGLRHLYKNETRVGVVRGPLVVSAVATCKF